MDNNHFDLAIKGINYPDEFDSNNIQLTQSQKNMIDKINRSIGTESKYDYDDENPDPIDCKYYSVDEHNNKKFNSYKHFSVLHLNVTLRNYV